MATRPFSPQADWLSTSHDELLDWLLELVSIPSDNPPGDCDAVATRTEAKLRALGLETDRFEIPRPGGGPAAPTVLGWLGPRVDNPRVLLNAHVDVIPPGEGWTVDPYTAGVIDGRVVGRGAAASKSDVAAYTYALASLLHRLEDPQGTAVLAVTSDEETGGHVGPAWLIGERGLRPENVICAGVTHQVGIAHNGCVQGRLLVSGTAAHAAMADGESDAIGLSARLLDLVRTYRAALTDRTSDVEGIGCPTIVVTSMQAGGTNGVTAGAAELGLDRRVIPEEDVDAVVEELGRLVANADATPGSAQFEPTLIVPPLRSQPSQNALAHLVQGHAERILGAPVPLRGVPIFTDARWFGNAGFPTIMFGAGPYDLTESRGHAADENVEVADLIASSHIVADSLTELLEGPSE